MDACRLRSIVLVAALALTSGWVLAANGPERAPARIAQASNPDRFDAPRAFRDLREQVALGPRPADSPGARRAARLIVDRLREAGAKDIGVQRRHRNVHATVRGTDPSRVVVIGAHYDTKPGIPGFLGANDAASGVAVLIELARSLPHPIQGASIELVFFDAEEPRGSRPFHRDGSRGAKLYVRAMKRGSSHTPPIAWVEGMILFDMVGDCDLHVPMEANSDLALYSWFAGAAADLGPPFAAVFNGTTDPVMDDHLPFIAAGIPAVDLIDFTYGHGPSPGGYWHTPKDNLDHVCRRSLNRVGETAVVAVRRLAAARPG